MARLARSRARRRIRHGQVCRASLQRPSACMYTVCADTCSTCPHPWVRACAPSMQAKRPTPNGESVRSFYDWIWGGADRLAVVRAMLATFKTAGIPVYISTKGDAGEVASILKHAGLEEYIAVVRDHHEGPKQRYILPWIAENPGGAQCPEHP